MVSGELARGIYKSVTNANETRAPPGQPRVLPLEVAPVYKLAFRVVVVVVVVMIRAKETT